MKAASCPFVIDPAGSDIQGEAAALRRLGSVAPVQLPGEVTAWAITGYELLRKLLIDPRVSKNPRLHWTEWINGRVPDDWPLHIWVSVTNMFTAYGPEHTRLRLLISKAFTLRRTAALRPRIEQLTADLLDALDQHEPGTEADLREGFAYPLPIEVICSLFGVPEELRSDLRRAVDGIFSTDATPAEALATQQILYATLQALVAARRNDPDDDLTSGLIAAQEDGSRLTEVELVDTLALVLGAGHETTVNLLDHAITALLTHPDQLDLVRTGRCSWTDVIDETLRWNSPIASLPLRYAVEDIDLGDVIIRQGEAILTANASAGRDESIHGDDSDRFDITRANKDHVSFGHGVHYCMGASLAKLEAEIALPALFERFPDMTLAVAPDELRPLASFISNGHRRLPVLLSSRGS